MSKYDIHKNKELPSDEEINKYKNFDKVMKKAALYDYKQATKPIYKNVKVLSIVAVIVAVGLVILFETTEQDEKTEEVIEQSDSLTIKNKTPIKDTLTPNEKEPTDSISKHSATSIQQQTITPITTTQEQVVEENHTSEITVIKNSTAEFKGGEDALKSYLEKNIKYPYNAVESPYSGKVEVDLIIEKTGKIGNFTIYHSPNAAISNEIKRIIKIMPDWNSAVKNGASVSSTVTVYFPFKYSAEN